MSIRHKKYRPKPLITNPLGAFVSVSNTNQALVVSTTTANAMQAMVQGRGTNPDWGRLSAVVNLSNVLCDQGVGAEYRPQVAAAKSALVEVGKRRLAGGSFTLKGEEMAALNEVLLIHEAQIVNIRPIDLDRAAAEVQRRLRYRINSTSVRAELEKA